MPFVEQAVGDAQEEQPVPEGRYDLLVDSCEEAVNETTRRTSYRCFIKIQNPPEDIKNAASIFFNLSMVMSDDSEKARNFMLLQQRRFFEAFSIPYEANGFDPDDIPGATAGNIHVTVGEYDKRAKNELNLPPVPEETAEKKAGGKRRRRA